jgi:hypothetical protein
MIKFCSGSYLVHVTERWRKGPDKRESSGETTGKQERRSGEEVNGEKVYLNSKCCYLFILRVVSGVGRR